MIPSGQRSLEPHPRVAITYAALERATVDIVARELADSIGGVLVRVHADEGEATVSLEAGLGHESEVLEKRDDIVLGRVRRKVPHINGCLPRWSLSKDHIIALDSLSRVLMVATKGVRGRHSHTNQSLLLRDGGLPLLVGPVAANGTRSEPLAVHGAEGLLSVAAVAESHKSIATGAAGLHVPHDAGLAHGPERRKSLQKDLIVDFIAEVTHEDVKVVGRVLPGSIVGLIGPVDADFLSKKTPRSA